MGQITIKELKKLLEKEIKKGNGDKFIVVSDDVEGNGYHGLFYGFADGQLLRDCLKYSNGLTNSDVEDTDKIIILG